MKNGVYAVIYKNKINTFMERGKKEEITTETKEEGEKKATTFSKVI